MPVPLSCFYLILFIVFSLFSFFSEDDSSLFSVSLSGHMYEWSLSTYTRVREYVSYDSAFVDIAINAEGAVAVGGVSMVSNYFQSSI
jgi:hypothetical protein